MEYKRYNISTVESQLLYDILEVQKEVLQELKKLNESKISIPVITSTANIPEPVVVPLSNTKQLEHQPDTKRERKPRKTTANKKTRSKKTIK